MALVAGLLSTVFALACVVILYRALRTGAASDRLAGEQLGLADRQAAALVDTSTAESTVSRRAWTDEHFFI